MGKNKYNPCKLAILKTLSYSGVFNYPLSLYQVSNNLISENPFPIKKIKKELKKLTKDGVIKNTRGKYILSDIKPCDTVKRIKLTKELIENNYSVVKTLEKVPWIKMIAVTGSAANYNVESKKGADLDLLFVTEKNRLWISRGFVFLILKILSKLPNNLEKREICPNIFVDERKLSWAKKKRNLYVAQNIIAIQPIMSKGDTYFRFMYENRWVFNYYQNFKINFPHGFKKIQKSKGFIFNLVENTARNMEVGYMKRKITTEVTTDKLIHFNKNDSSKIILTSYKKILKNLKNIID